MGLIEEQKRRRIEELVDSGKNNTEIHRETRYSRTTVIRHANSYRASGAVKEGPPAKPVESSGPKSGDMHVTEKGDEKLVGLYIDRPITTKEDMIAVAKIDSREWYVDSLECRSWTNSTTDKEKNAHLHGMFYVRAKLKRIAPKPYLDAMEALFGNLEKNAPRYISAPMPPPKDRPFLLEIDQHDVHFANLCWAAETGENDDLKISEAKFRNSTNDLMSRIAGYDIDLALLPVGNDLFHSDNLIGTTTAGTPQDCDGRYPKMIEVVERSAIEACETILTRAARLRVIYTPGNHDQLSSYHLCRTLAAWFRNCDRVEVDLSPRYRKYEHHGVCLFGYTHGNHMNAGKLKTLPSLMAVENPEAWAKSTCREFKLGHIHTSRSNELHGVMIRHLSSLSGTNAWHFAEGYVGNRKAAEAYLYSFEDGFVGNFIARARV